MIILHAGFGDRRLHLWGESPPGEGVVSVRRRRRPSPQEEAASFIYATEREDLLEVVKGIPDFPRTSLRDFSRSVIWLPTVDGNPFPSNSTIGEEAGSSSEVALAPWSVPALSLDAERALLLLCACADKDVLKPGVIVGHDVSFWGMAMRLAGALVARQQFLPTVIRENGSHHARWKAIVAGADVERMHRLAGAMPAVAQALHGDPHQPPVARSAERLSDFVNLLVDHLVRFSGYAKAPSSWSEGMRRGKPLNLESLHDHWLFALRSFDDRLDGKEDALSQFAAQVNEWQRPVSVLTTSPFRLCFRLEEPPENGVASPAAQGDAARWQVHYLLQAAHDPSLHIPVKEAWKPGKNAAGTLLGKGGFKAREYLLLSLGQAAALCPRIEKSLRSVRPEGYELDSSGAYEFLTEKALALEQSGFGVMVPAWWTGKGTKLRLATRAHVKSPVMQTSGMLSLDQLVDFHWEVSLGGESMSYEELQALVRLKAPLVKIRGQWAQLTSEEIQAAIDVWKKKSAGTMTAREVVKLALGAANLPLAFDGVRASGWVGQLMAQLEGRAQFELLEAPERFVGTLRPYQLRGYSWLSFLKQWGLGACLADDMGLGKTIQTLALLDREFLSNHQRPVLLICPTSVVGNWHKESARFTPHLRIMVHHGISRAKGSSFAGEVKKHHLVISSYALLQRDFEILKDISWSGVVLDEAQNIKNPETKQARASRNLRADYRIALTGTPVENNVGDLWSIMEFLNPGLLGTQTEFKKRFFIPIQASRDPAALTGLKRLTGPFVLRRLKTDQTIISDLPKKMEMKVFCTLTKEQASLYAAVVKEAAEALDSSEGIQRKGMVLATLSKLKQVCNHPAQFMGDHSSIPGRSGKLARLTEMTQEVLEAGDRALIFSQFSQMGEILKRHLEETFGQETLFLHGGVPKNRRDRMVERFQQPGDGPRLFILSLKAGGTGLNLTGANHVFHFDRWWNPAVENQATDRAFRIGQRKRVQVHKFLCVGTLEEKIDEMIERKKEIAEGAVGAGEGWLTKLSTAELKEIFALRKEAVED
ncbi:MAG: DEAD/DEAH box helicase [Acidobacteriia bacterium]|nr:DEAD/DEAH box helicase [Terriglobia bacterium]